MEKELTEFDRVEMKEAEKVHDTFSRYVNGQANPAMFAECVMRDHRTLQQNMSRVIFACVTRWAMEYDKGYYDARNEDTVTLCHDIVEKFGDRMFFPFI